MADKIYGISSGLSMDILNRMGLQTVSFQDFREVPEGKKVIIYDKDGVLDREVFKYLIERACDLKYLYEEDGEINAKYLQSQNVFDIYSGIGQGDLTSELIMEVIESRKTKKDTVIETGDNLNLMSFSVCYSLVQSFLEAISKADEDMITKLYNNDLNRMLELTRFIEEENLSKENMRRENLKSLEQNDIMRTRMEKAEANAKKVISNGKLLENDNAKLLEYTNQLTKTLEEKDELLKKTLEENELLSSDKQELRSDLKNVTEDYEILQANNARLKIDYDRLIKETDKLSETLNKTTIKTSNLNITLSNTGNVKKLLYVKVIDMVPFFMSTMKFYVRMIRAKFDGCAVVFVVPSNGIHKVQYENDFKLIENTTDFSESLKDIYMMEDYSLNIKKLIEETEARNLMIVDLTLKNNIFTNSVRQKNVYVINSEESLIRNKLNPSDCLSFTDLKAKGVRVTIPLISEKELSSVPKKTTILKDSLTPMESWWS